MRRALVPLCLLGCNAIFGIHVLDDDGGVADAAPETSVPDAAPFCGTSNHYYCNDFDESTKVSYGFNQDLTTGPQAPFILDTTQYVSPPQSLAMDTPAGFGKACRQFAKQFATPTPFKVATFTFQLYVDTLNGATLTILFFDPAAVGTTQTLPEMGLLLDPSNNALIYTEIASDNTITNHYLSQGTNNGIQTHVWYLVSIVMDVSKATFDASATPTSGPVFGVAGTSFDGGAPVPSTTTPFFEFGACATAGPTPSTHIFFDNLTLDFTF